MNFRSIHTRLISWYTVLIICASVAFGAYTYYSLHNHLYEAMCLTLTRRIEHIRNDILPVAADPAQLKSRIEQIYSPEESNRFIRVAKIGGPVLYVSGLPQDREFNPASVPFAVNGNHGCTRVIEDGLLIVRCSTALNNANYEIAMGAPTAEIDGILRKLILTLLIGLPAVALLAITGGAVLVRRALLPVEDIRATAEQITFSNLSQRLPAAATGDAIEHLSRTLNQMLERLDQAYQQASRFSADASHELRTPLTIMRSELEALEATMRAWQLPMEIRVRIGSVLEEAERLSGIVEGLFAIARLDAGEAKIGHEIFDLAALSRSTLEQMQLLADEKRLSVTIEAPQAVFVAGDAARLKQVVVNLFDNAIKYTGTGGAIGLAVFAQSSQAILNVTDNGVGISAQSLAHVFERFYRADKVRSRTSQGAGLGLSIVRAICQAHGGSVRIASEEGAGTSVTVELPLAEAIPQNKIQAAA